MLKSLSFALLTGASLAFLLGCDVDVHENGAPAEAVELPDMDAPEADGPDVDVVTPGVSVETEPLGVDVDVKRD